LGNVELAEGVDVTVVPRTLGCSGTVGRAAVVASGGAGKTGVVVATGAVGETGGLGEVGAVGATGPVGGFAMLVANGGAVVVVAAVVVVVSTAPAQLEGRVTCMVRDTDVPSDTAIVMVTENDGSDIERPEAVASRFPLSNDPMTLPTVTPDTVTPSETDNPVTVAEPG
jgi:hypothetical protein